MSAHRDLIKRLYAPATGGNTRPLRTEAADALHALVAENETLHKECGELRAALKAVTEAPRLYDADKIARAALAAARGCDAPREYPHGHDYWGGVGPEGARGGDAT